jgi:hypothetical protein
VEKFGRLEEKFYSVQVESVEKLGWVEKNFA